VSRYELTLSFNGPVNTAGDVIVDIGVDRTMARDAFGRLVLPASHIKGRLREALEQVISLTGAPPEQGAQVASWLFGDDAHPGRVTISDFAQDVLPDATAGALTELSAEALLLSPPAVAPSGSPAQPAVHPQVAIDRRYGRALDRALAFREAPGFGQRTAWRGLISIPDGGTPPLSHEEAAGLLGLAVRWLDTLGSGNNTGWGWLCDKRWGDPAPPLLDAAALAALADRARAVVAPSIWRPVHHAHIHVQAKEQAFEFLDMAIVLHGPVLLGEEPRAGNYQESPDHLPGSAIKRALADVIAAAAGFPRNTWIDDAVARKAGALAPLAEAFTSLQVRHGLPVDPEALDGRIGGEIPRPRAVPLTALRRKGADVPDGDALVYLLLGEAWPSDHAMGSQWLDRSMWTLDGRAAAPGRWVRTRTAVGRPLRAARDGALFTYSAVHPVARRQDGQERRQAFLGRIGYSGGAAVRAALEAALAGMNHIGKAISAGLGEVRAYLVRGAQDEFGERLSWWQARCGAGLVPLSLNTDALLLPPDALAERHGRPLGDLYQRAWQEIIRSAGGPPVRLHEEVGVIADHLLRGGRTAGGLLVRPPVVLTAAGSVFVLRCRPEDDLPLRQALARLSQRGAAVPGLLEEVSASRERDCPFRPDCGYGEITVCHPMHTSLMEKRA
jgi:hypothetical protein